MRNKGEILSVLSVTSVVKKIAAYAKLLRLSNAPTAVADVWMGYAVTLGVLSPSYAVGLASFASLAAYHGGMALNDAADAPNDEALSRGRPIERGFISRRVAYSLAYGSLVASLIAAVCLSIFTEDSRIAGIGLALVLAILAYNSPLKRSWLGPLLMGSCRLLNVLLGVFAVSPAELMSVTHYEAGTTFAILIGVYIAGVTLYARDESQSCGRRQLIAGCVVSTLAIAAFAFVSIINSFNALIWAIVGLFATRGMVAAILQPTPRNIGRGVGIAIQGLVVIDATLATLYAGPVAGLAILALLPVTMLLARWIPQT
jgi:4-hydroxybenzoate polyprenyltransferase